MLILKSVRDTRQILTKNLISNVKAERQCFQYLFVPLYFFNVFLIKIAAAFRSP